MKKLMILALIALIFAACEKKTTEKNLPSEFVGTWNLTEFLTITNGGEPESLDELVGVMGFTFNSDGSGEGREGQTVYNLTWEVLPGGYLSIVGDQVHSGDIVMHTSGAAKIEEITATTLVLSGKSDAPFEVGEGDKDVDVRLTFTKVE